MSPILLCPAHSLAYYSSIIVLSKVFPTRDQGATLQTPQRWRKGEEGVGWGEAGIQGLVGLRPNLAIQLQGPVLCVFQVQGFLEVDAKNSSHFHYHANKVLGLQSFCPSQGSGFHSFNKYWLII